MYDLSKIQTDFYKAFNTYIDVFLDEALKDLDKELEEDYLAHPDDPFDREIKDLFIDRVSTDLSNKLALPLLGNGCSTAAFQLDDSTVLKLEILNDEDKQFYNNLRFKAIYPDKYITIQDIYKFGKYNYMVCKKVKPVNICKILDNIQCDEPSYKALKLATDLYTEGIRCNEQDWLYNIGYTEDMIPLVFDAGTYYNAVDTSRDFTHAPYQSAIYYDWFVYLKKQIDQGITDIELNEEDYYTYTHTGLGRNMDYFVKRYFKDTLDIDITVGLDTLATHTTF